MKLVDPTLDQLDAAFAEHVAGWMWRDERGGAWFLKSDDPDPYSWVRITDENGADIGLVGLRFTRSADAVLPWLDKHDWKSKRYVSSSVDYHVVEIENGGVSCGIEGVNYTESTEEKSFPLAAVVALLRAHGVEVEFTK